MVLARSLVVGDGVFDVLVAGGRVRVSQPSHGPEVQHAPVHHMRPRVDEHLNLDRRGREALDASPGQIEGVGIPDKLVPSADNEMEDVVAGRVNLGDLLQVEAADPLLAPVPRLVIDVEAERAVTPEAHELLAARSTEVYGFIRTDFFQGAAGQKLEEQVFAGGPETCRGQKLFAGRHGIVDRGLFEIEAFVGELDAELVGRLGARIGHGHIDYLEVGEVELALRREGVVAIAVGVADASVRPVDHDLAAFADGLVTCRLGGLGLGAVGAADATGSLGASGPAGTVGDDVDALGHAGEPQKLGARLACRYLATPEFDCQPNIFNVYYTNIVCEFDIGSDSMQTSLMRDREIYEALGQQIAARRNALNLRQRDLAEKVEMSRASVANIERGRQSMPVHHLYRFAEALEIRDVVELLPPIPAGRSSEDELLGLSFSMEISEKSKAAMSKLLSRELSQRKR